LILAEPARLTMATIAFAAVARIEEAVVVTLVHGALTNLVAAL
jgi:hypothetical protein